MALLVGLSASAVSASAASLGGITAKGPFVDGDTFSIPDPEPPGPIVFTDFSGCSNFIDGWTDESGNVWTSRSGNWQCLGSGVVRAQQRIPFANLTVGISQSTDIRISTEISDISHQNNRSGPGLSLLDDGSGEFVYVVYRRDEAQLSIGSTNGPVDSYDVGGLEAATLTATVAGGQLDVEFDGSVYSYTIPTGFTTARVGLIADNDNQSRFGSFLVEDLS